jgi:hypothetical protein
MERMMDAMNGGMETGAPMPEIGGTDGGGAAARPRPKRPKAVKKAPKRAAGKKRPKAKARAKARKTGGTRAKKRGRR